MQRCELWTHPQLKELGLIEYAIEYGDRIIKIQC